MDALKQYTPTLLTVSLLLIAPISNATPSASEYSRAAKSRASAAERDHASPRHTKTRSMMERLLDAADLDQDGRVSPVELDRFVQKEVLEQVARRVPKLDRNSDGWVHRHEVPDMPETRFTRFDIDGDGAFTVWELAQVMRQQAMARCRVVFAQLDADSDGMLSARDVELGERERVAAASSRRR